jgi:hypothetical protein
MRLQILTIVTVTYDRSVVFSTNKTDPPRYNWNIVESGIKNPNSFL